MSRILVADCLFFACETTGVPRDQVLGHGRTRDVVAARHLGMWLARRFTEASYQTIAHRYGRVDHTTVHSAIRTVKLRRDNSAKFAAQLAADEARFAEWASGIVESRALALTRSAFIQPPVSAQQPETAR